MNATEQYLLGEFRGEVLQEFEEHYFSCPVCAQDVKAGMALMVSGKEVARLDKRTAKERSDTAAAGWFAWLRPAIAVPVMATLLLIVGYQNIVSVPKLERRVTRAEKPKVIRSFPLAALQSRGGGDKTLSVAPGHEIDLVLDVPVNNFSSYTCKIEAQTGATLYTIPSCSEYDRNTIEISVPPGALPAGRYSLVVLGAGSNGSTGAGTGANDSEIIRQSFSLELNR